MEKTTYAGHVYVGFRRCLTQAVLEHCTEKMTPLEEGKWGSRGARKQMIPS